MKTIKKFGAQGDVMFRRVKKVPEGYTKSDNRIVAHSETGHHHTADGNLEVWHNPNNAMLSYITVKGEAEITHHRAFDTHETMKLLTDDPEGETIWEIRRQREYSPEGWRMVMD